MKMTKRFIKWFERQQKLYGTKVALNNLLWLQATRQLHDLGYKTIKTNG